MPKEILLQAAVQGLQMGAIYALIALSMTLVFSVGGLIEFCPRRLHGARHVWRHGGL